jgi:glycosyltransferase involved in cell wall biosynthesis
MKKILWLASWYPSKVDPFTGDFIERHARAASLHSQIEVLFVVKDNAGFFQENITEERRQYKEGGKATIIYYKVPNYLISLFGKMRSTFLFLKIHFNFLNKYIRQNGKPDGLHVHTGMKSGLAALFFKIWFGLPYVVSEHWAGFCPESIPGFSDKTFLFRWLWKKVLKNARDCSAVSAHLAALLQKQFSLNKVSIIPNVVDSGMFFPSGKAIKNSRFIHVSGSNHYQKNVSCILDAVALLVNKLPDFSLVIFGTPDELIEKRVQALNIGHAIEFKGMCSQDILREYMQESSALILYSRYETFGCVIIEANACGRPVIVTDIPVFHENVAEGLTGVFVEPDNPELLSQKIYSIANGLYRFDEDFIQKWAVERYSFEKVGRQFAEFYDQHFD